MPDFTANITAWQVLFLFLRNKQMQSREPNVKSLILNASTYWFVGAGAPQKDWAWWHEYSQGVLRGTRPAQLKCMGSAAPKWHLSSSTFVTDGLGKEARTFVSLIHTGKKTKQSICQYWPFSGIQLGDIFFVSFQGTLRTKTVEKVSEVNQE